MFLSKERKKNIVLNGNLYGGLLILSLPIIFNNFMQTIYNLVDTYWVGQIPGQHSDLAVAAVGGVFPVTQMILAFGMGLYVTANSLMSQSIGANDRKQANFIASQAFSFSILLGVFFMIIGFVITPFLVGFLFQDQIISGYATDYLSVIFFETPFVFAFLIFTGMRQSKGDTLIPVIISVLSNIFNMILDPLFILVLNWGIAGAAWATVLSKIIIVPIWIVIAFKGNDIRLNVKKMIPHGPTIRKMVKIAIPSSVGQAINSAGFAALQGIVEWLYGGITMAAFNITNRINSIAMMPALGVGSALTFVVGQNIGNEDYKRVRKAFIACINLTAILSAIGMIFVLIPATGSKLITLFLDGEEAVGLSLYFLKFVAFNIPLMGLYQSQMGIFNGAGKTGYGFILTVARLWAVRIPMILLFEFVFDMGSISLYVSMLVSNILILLAGHYLYKRGSWQRRLIDTSEEPILKLS